VEEFLSKHAEDVIGTLSGFDRLCDLLEKFIDQRAAHERT
jgi:hypothetical protein